MRVDEFACARGATEAVASKLTAERVWQPKFLAEIMSGRDPTKTPETTAVSTELTVGEFLDRYDTTYVEGEGLKSAATVRGHLKALKAELGDLPVSALEKPSPAATFKANYRPGRQVATVNRALGVLRAAINWGRFQDPPLLTTTPFHRFGISVRSKDETKRDRRLHRDEERALLAACNTMTSPEHKHVGPAMHDRIIGALETCCRQGEMLRIQNRDVDWEQHQVVIRGANAKDGENRRIPFDPDGRLAPILKRRAVLGPTAYVFGTPKGTLQESFKTAWESLLLVAHGHDPTRSKPGARVAREALREIDLHWHDLRHHAEPRIMPIAVDSAAVWVGDSSREPLVQSA
jgi:integrase